MSFAALLVVGVLVVGAIVRNRPVMWLLAGAALVASVSLFYRYLKFFRHYSIEVFTSFLTSVPEGQAAGDPTGSRAATQPGA